MEVIAVDSTIHDPADDEFHRSRTFVSFNSKAGLFVFLRSLFDDRLELRREENTLSFDHISVADLVSDDPKRKSTAPFASGSTEWLRCDSGIVCKNCSAERRDGDGGLNSECDE